MWHEARRREKATQKLFNDHKKRAEKRREENKVDPRSLLQVNGLKTKLCIDPCAYKQGIRSLVAWQGDKSLMIDRFDVRATLSSIPTSSDSTTSTSSSAQPKRGSTVFDSNESESMKRFLNYERYRLLIQTDLNKVDEELRLRLVEKSDVASDAKMKKLRNNKFGTSGEANPSSNQSNTYKTVQAREQTKRPGIGVGSNYSSVPPPLCLSDTKETCRQQTSEFILENAKNTTMDIVDSDEFDNSELDSISSLIPRDNKKMNEIAQKYGLSCEEYALMAKKDNQEIGSACILRDLVRLSKENKTAQERNTIQVADHQVYGPALPPELAGSSNYGIDQGSVHSSEDSSCVRQRSPSGGNIPLRNGSRSDESESLKSGEYLSQRSTKRQLLSPDQNLPAASLLNLEPVKVTEIRKSKLIHVEHHSSQVCESQLSSPDSLNHPDHSRRSRGTKKSSPNVRRAPTPLAYKRNRRSSRSLSRERRTHHRTTNSWRRTTRRHRSKSRSSPTSSASSVSYRKLSRRKEASSLRHRKH